MILVANIKLGDSYTTYVGRGSAYGNPFSHLRSKYNTIKVATVTEAIELYREWLTSPGMKLIGWNKPTTGAIEGLRDKILGCYCRPIEGFLGRLLCHGQILAGLANSISPETIE